MDSCGEVLADAEDGKLLIVTSALALAEVLALRWQPKIPKDRRDTVERFFKNEYIVVRALTRRIAEQGRELVWNHGIAPKDACHVATALEARLDMMHSFDLDLCKKSGQVGGTPPLQIKNPFVVAPRLQLREPAAE